MARLLVLASLLSALVTTSACGHRRASGPRVSAPFTATDERAFDNAVDLVTDPDVLEGRWYDDWATDVVNRVAAADSVMIVNVEALTHDTTPDQKETYRIQTTTVRVISGQRVDDFTFPVQQDQAGFESVASNESRILRKPFVAFLKWRAEGDEIVARWHLSPASNAMVQTVENATRNRARITTHTN